MMTCRKSNVGVPILNLILDFAAAQRSHVGVKLHEGRLQVSVKQPGSRKALKNEILHDFSLPTLWGKNNFQARQISQQFDLYNI